MGLTPKKDMLAEFERGHIPRRGPFRYRRGGGQAPHCRICRRQRRESRRRGGGPIGHHERDTLVIYDEGNQFLRRAAGGLSGTPRRRARLRAGRRAERRIAQARCWQPARRACPADVQRPVQRRRGGGYAAKWSALGTPVHADARRRAFMPKPEPRPPAPRPYSRQHQHSVRRAAGKRPLQPLEALRQTFNDKGWISTARSSPAAARRDGGGVGVRPASRRARAGQAV
ncbi:hypothetical protein M8494_18470 [Serratia ureilytica]